MSLKRTLLLQHFGPHQGIILYVLERHYLEGGFSLDIPVEWRSMEWFRRLQKYGDKPQRWNTSLLRRHLSELCKKGLLRRRVGCHGSPTAFWLDRERLKAELGLSMRSTPTPTSPQVLALKRNAP